MYMLTSYYLTFLYVPWALPFIKNRPRDIS